MVISLNRNLKKKTLNDGLLSREEFSLYNLRVSGEEVNDEEWEVVEGQCQRVKVKVKGF